MSFAKLELVEYEKCNGYKIHLAEFEQNERFDWNQISEDDDVIQVTRKKHQTSYKRLGEFVLECSHNCLVCLSY